MFLRYRLNRKKNITGDMMKKKQAHLYWVNKKQAHWADLYWIDNHTYSKVIVEEKDDVPEN